MTRVESFQIQSNLRKAGLEIPESMRGDNPRQVRRTGISPTDRFDSTPEIEHYNNYSKNGVLMSAASAEAVNDSVYDTLISNLNAIPESWGVWHTDSFPPNWNDIPHKGMTALSKDEIKNLMRALAEKFNNTTNEFERARIGRQAATMKTYYVSHGSPDNRQELFEQAMRTINKHAGSGRMDFNHTDQKTLLDYLMAREAYSTGKGMKEGVPYPIAGGGTVTFAAVVGSNSGARFEVEHNGQPAMSITISPKSSVNFMANSEEMQLNDEINAFWFRAIGNSAFS
jgi:hypothetical protein